MAGQNKEKDAGRDTAREPAKETATGKEGRDGKEKKNKDDVPRRLSEFASDLADLRRLVTALSERQDAAPPPAPAANDANATDTPLALTEADDALIARVGYALSSAPKVALIRLLYMEGEQSASQLGEKAGLTTGSLYHHLRELIHAELVVQQTRTRYQLTARGHRALAALTPLARE